MIIKSIEYENFRNFKEHGEIFCSTDGKMTVIYGKNGDGKTTLHQLFQWILYGNLNFNRTTTDRLYNLSFEAEQKYGQVFEVLGRIIVEHDNDEYVITRTAQYKKQLNESLKIGEDFYMQKREEDYNFKRVDRPNEVIERMLPSGLSEYFFFDGESMIADLRVKGKDSAQKLRRALYSMFDLDVTESAINHIGRTDLKTTVLGKLYLSKGTIVSGSSISAVRNNVEQAQNEISKAEEEINTIQSNIDKCNQVINDVSEKIGEAKTKSDYEKQRKDLKRQRDHFLEAEEECRRQFGDSIIEMFPRLLISKAVENAQNKLKLKVDYASDNLPVGITKELVDYLANVHTEDCICGRHMGKSEKDRIDFYLSLLPPRSYTLDYQTFKSTASSSLLNYDKEKIDKIIINMMKNSDWAKECDDSIRELDEEEKKSKDCEDLIIARQLAEANKNEYNQELLELEKKKQKLEIYLKQQQARYDSLTASTAIGQQVQVKIDIMSDVLKYFKDKLESASVEYSRKLQTNIQELMNSMLTSKRTVVVSNEFAVTVTDSYNDESKSEGQFAVVSFAYIGGILKMLREEESISSKEYPLVLDGPFSKLDLDQRQNVVETLPTFAKQVIIFSKEDLHSVIPGENIGRVYTIRSNEEKNVAKVEEGKLW